MTASALVTYNASSGDVVCEGDWNLAHFPKLQSSLQKITWSQSREITFDGSAITSMDSAGAWLLDEWQKKLAKKNINVSFKNFSAPHQALLEIVGNAIEEEKPFPKIEKTNFFAFVGKHVITMMSGFNEYLSFVGELTMDAFRSLRSTKNIRIESLANVIYRSGYQALPIIALLSFLIGVVITYQMGLQLRNYGANIYIVDLLGLSILREFGPLITSIMVAGRTGSAFTAQIGMMKLNQEIDALNTMGVTPAELLVLPRIIGLFITLPLLTMWADIFGIIGGIVMSNNMLNITWYDFLHRFPHVIPLRSLIMGLGKAPIFALVIASVACFQGMQVKGDADSMGRNTTRSVVLSIFFIMVADAIFSVIFSKLKL